MKRMRQYWRLCCCSLAVGIAFGAAPLLSEERFARSKADAPVLHSAAPLETSDVAPRPRAGIERADGQRSANTALAPAKQLPEALRQAAERYGYPGPKVAAPPTKPPASVSPTLNAPARPSAPIRPNPAPPPMAAVNSSRRTSAPLDSTAVVVSHNTPELRPAVTAARLVRQEPLPPGNTVREGMILPAPTLQPMPNGRFPERVRLNGDGTITLDQATALAIEFNPILRSAVAQIESARGTALQAGLWNNPRWDTNNPQVLGTGQNNLYNAGFEMEIPMKGKKRLDRAAAEQMIRRAIFDYRTDRANMLAAVRQQFYGLLAQQRRVEISRELVVIAKRAQDVAEALRRAGEQAEIDVLALSIELQRAEAALLNAERILEGRRRTLSATIGLPNLPVTQAVGRIDAQFPNFNETELRQYVALANSRVGSARAEVDRRRILSERAEVEPFPNPYTGPAAQWGAPHVQGQFWYNIQFNIPVWDWNQGNRRAAQANIRDAQASLNVLQNDLLRQAADALSRYRAARALAERYGRVIMPLSLRNQELNREAYEKRQFELARFLQAQRVLTETYLEYINSLEELWNSAADVGNLMQLEQFP
jgi:cobalt-zinc-cadmium efflux system outer membrane protein